MAGIAPLVAELENGDEVDIIRSDAQVPPPAWENIAVTGKARAAIRRATRAAMRKQFAGLGREIVEKLLAKQNKPMVAKEIAAAVPRLGHKNVDDTMAAIGRGDLSGYDMLKAMGLTVEASQMRESRRKGTAGKKSDPAHAASVPVRGLSGNMLSPFPRKPVRFRASALWALPCRARALRSIRFSPGRWNSSTASRSAGSILPGTAPPRIRNFRRGSISCF
jgi:(p)ppGpp synthase/HD superfamily hydrolase